MWYWKSYITDYLCEQFEKGEGVCNFIQCNVSVNIYAITVYGIIGIF